MVPGLLSGLGFIGSGLANENAREASHEGVQNAIKRLEATKGYADQAKAQGEQILADMLGSNRSLWGSPEEAAAALSDAQSRVNGLTPYEAGQFQYGKSVDDFFDPAFQLSVNQANDAINQSQALGGNLFSSDTANKIAAQNQVLATQMYNDALNAYQADKSLEQGIWQGNEQAKQAAATSAANLANAQYQMAADRAGNLSSADNAYYQALMGLNGDFWKNKTDYQAQLAALESQDPGHRDTWQRVFDPLNIDFTGLFR